MSYKRVIPRDFFNESKLLKCFGQLALKVQDELLPDGIFIKITENGEPFNIVRDDSSGDLFLSNYRVLINGKLTLFYSKFNNLDPYPFYCIVNDEMINVFDNQGEFTDEFRNLEI